MHNQHQLTNEVGAKGQGVTCTYEKKNDARQEQLVAVYEVTTAIQDTRMALHISLELELQLGLSLLVYACVLPTHLHPCRVQQRRRIQVIHEAGVGLTYIRTSKATSKAAY